jgi:glycosyltransferase involved in cell wall biosynthesis
MKILLINTFPSYGGASLACQRLADALTKHTDLSIKTLNLYENSKKNNIESNKQENIAKSFWQKTFTKYKFASERLQVRLAINNIKHLYSFSPASQGWDISKHAWVEEADVLHLHWVNFGFLSLNNLKQLFALGKPIVWTMHDLWAVTGGCHYPSACTNFEKSCGSCPMLYFSGKNDWSSKIFKQKFNIFYNKNIHWVGCSRWIADEVGKSGMVKRSINSNFFPKISAIPNPIDTDAFLPFSKEKKQEIRTKLGLPLDKFLILFGAMNIQDERKGFDYLVKSLEILKEKSQEKYHNIANKIQLLIFGKTPKNLPNLPFEVHNLGVLNGTNALCEAYNSADVFVLPSLEDNLPNTLMETLACGTPSVAFDTGGIPEMLTHQKSGYIATYKNAEDLANGIYFCANNTNYQELQQEARNEVMNKYTQKRVAEMYEYVYKMMNIE